MNILEDNCVDPGWMIVEKASEVGIRQPKDNVWRFAGAFKGIMGVVPCNSHYCLPTKADPALGQHPKDKLLLHPVPLSREEFIVRGAKLVLYVGQCRRCGFIYWGTPVDREAA